MSLCRKFPKRAYRSLNPLMHSVVLGCVLASNGKSAEEPAMQRGICGIDNTPDPAGVFQIKAEQAQTFKELGWIYLTQGEAKKALEVLGKALEVKPGDREARILRAQSLAWSNCHEEAVQELRQILDEDPANVGAFYIYGITLMWMGKLDESEVQFQRMLRLSPDNIGAHSGLARLRALKWEYDEAEQAYSKLLESKTGKMAALLGLAETNEWLQNWTCARERYEDMIELEPMNVMARAGLKRIRTRTSPSVRLSYETHSDSYDLHRTLIGGTVGFDFEENSRIALRLDQWKIYQRNAPASYRNDHTLSISQHLSRFIDWQLSYSIHSYLAGKTTSSISSAILFNYRELALARLSLGHRVPLLESMPAFTSAISASCYGVDIDFRPWRRLSVQAGYSLRVFSDENRKDSAYAQISYRLSERNKLFLRLRCDYTNFEEQSSLYWAPSNLTILSMIFDWRFPITENLSLAVDGKCSLFPEHDDVGFGAGGQLEFAITDYTSVLLHTSFYDARTQNPWLGKGVRIEVAQSF